MTNVEALKALYAALGGTAADVANDNLSAEIINAIANLDIGGSSLPDVTNADNGNILTVVSGSWSKIASMYTATGIGGGNYKLDNGVKQSDIYASLSINSNTVIKVNNNWLRLSHYDTETDTYMLTAIYYTGLTNPALVTARIQNVDGDNLPITSVSLSKV